MKPNRYTYLLHWIINSFISLMHLEMRDTNSVSCEAQYCHLMYLKSRFTSQPEVSLFRFFLLVVDLIATSIKSRIHNSSQKTFISGYPVMMMYIIESPVQRWTGCPNKRLKLQQVWYGVRGDFNTNSTKGAISYFICLVISNSPYVIVCSYNNIYPQGNVTYALYITDYTW